MKYKFIENFLISTNAESRVLNSNFAQYYHGYGRNSFRKIVYKICEKLIPLLYCIILCKIRFQGQLASEIIFTRFNNKYFIFVAT